MGDWRPATRTGPPLCAGYSGQAAGGRPGGRRMRVGAAASRRAVGLSAARGGEGGAGAQHLVSQVSDDVQRPPHAGCGAPRCDVVTPRQAGTRTSASRPSERKPPRGPAPRPTYHRCSRTLLGWGWGLTGTLDGDAEPESNRDSEVRTSTPAHAGPEGGAPSPASSLGTASPPLRRARARTRTRPHAQPAGVGGVCHHRPDRRLKQQARRRRRRAPGAHGSALESG
jgi:hypothetical protein